MNPLKVLDENVKENSKELDLSEINARKGYMATKRGMDSIGALCGLIFLSPIF